MHPDAIQILETALALQRAPGERFRLRERPLPEGLVHVMEVASGAPTAVMDAATALGIPEQAVLDASRFYLEQVLFASPDADAYRILGVSPEASTEEIRRHHRWLQRWLHPDRAQAGDASVFATRVNQAWSQLRTPEARHEYEVRRAEARMAQEARPFSPETIRPWYFEDPQAAVHGRRSRWLLGTALATCAVLAILIARHEGAVETWEPGAPRIADEAAPARDPAPEATPSLAEALATVRPEATPVEPAPRAAQPARVSPPVRPPAPAAAVATTSAPHPDPVPAPTPAPIAVPVDPAPSRAAPRTPALPAPAPPIALNAPPGPGGAPHVAAAPAPVAPEAELLIERMHKAEQRVAQLAAYLSAQPDAAPLWNDVRTQSSAARLRDRIAGKAGAKFELIAPNWQLQPEQASFSAGYRCNACRVQQGRLDVQLVWRAGLWLVRGVDVAPDA